MKFGCRREVGMKAIVLSLVLFINLGTPGEGRSLLQGIGTGTSSFAEAVRTEISGIVFTNLRGDQNVLRNELKLKILEHKAQQAINRLRLNVNAIISNVLVGDKANVKVFVDVLVGNKAVIDTVTAELEAYAVNQLNGTGIKSKTKIVIDAVSNSKWVNNMKLNLTGLTYNDVNGDDNRADASLKVTFAKGTTIGLKNDLAKDIDESRNQGNGTDFGAPDVEVVLEAILVNEVISGRDNFLDNVLKIAAFNGADISNMKATIEAILVNRVEGLKNGLFNVMDIAIGECRYKNRGKCKQKYAAFDISSILLNDVLGDNNFIDNLVKITGAASKIKGKNKDAKNDDDGNENDDDGNENDDSNNDGDDETEDNLADLRGSLFGALIEVEAIVVNTLQPDGVLDNVPEVFGTDIRNTMNLEFFRDSTLGQIDTLITSIISNDVLGRDNQLDNILDIQLGNGLPHKNRRRL